MANAIETEEEERNEEEKEWMRNDEKFPLHWWVLFFCFVETDNTRKQPFSLRGFLALSPFGFRFCVEIKKIHSIANKGKYKNYFDTKIIA